MILKEMTDEDRREQFVKIRQARDIIRSTPPNMARLQNLPCPEKICPVEAKFYRRFGVRIVNEYDA